MRPRILLNRRSFLGLMAASPLAAYFPGYSFASSGSKAPIPELKQLPVGLELYSVRDELKKNLMGTLEGVARMGYQCVEFFAPYYEWTLEYAQRVRAELDRLNVRCYSTHNDPRSFHPDGIGKAIDLNQALGARYVVLASAGPVQGVDGWKRVADMLNRAHATLTSHHLNAGYHNHEAEWRPVDGQKPMEILAANTDRSIMLQLDVGTCLEAGSDPVAWIKQNPGRIRSMHVKEWSPQKGYRVLLGEGVAPWKEIFAAAETTGGIEYYLIEQEGSDYSEMETAKRCLEIFHKMHT
jgi:sugar phosphate isomerase/epimerase